MRVRQRAGGGSTVEETCALSQAAQVRSQRAWCGGEGDCARKRAGSSAEEERICMEERAFRARWGAQGTRGGRRIRSALEWQGEAQTPN